MEDLVKTILNSMSRIKSPQIKIMTIMLCGFCFYQGRSNMMNMSRFVKVSRKTIWTWSKRLFNFSEFNAELIAGIGREKTHNYVAALDASFIHKSGSKTSGIGYYYNGCASRVEKGLEINCIALVNQTLNSAFSLTAYQSKPKEKKPKTGNQENSITHALNAIKAEKQVFQRFGVTKIVADGWYTKKSFVDGALEQNLDVVCKFRRDANLKYLYEGEYSGRGRPKIYGDKVNLESLDGFETVDGKFNLIYFVKIVHSVSLKRNIKVVVLRSKNSEKNRAILYSTNLDDEPHEIVDTYKSRFQIEFIFRDAKQFCGLEDCEARNYEAIHNHINTSLTAVNLLKFEALNMGKTDKKQVISIATARRRKSNQFVAEIILSKLDQELSDDKISEIMDSIESISNIAA